MAAKKLGIVQSRGLGDIIIALPIACWYKEDGWDIVWPIMEVWAPQMEQAVPWVKWVPIPPDTRGSFFYDEPMKRLQNLGVDETICLYQALTGHPEFAARPEFQITGFDQYKYHVADVPFIQKWTLKDCIQRNPEREAVLKQQVIKDPDKPYAVTHLEGSDYTCHLNVQDWIPEDWNHVQITEKTDSVFDWLGVIEGADAGVFVDSVFSNLVDQLQLTDTVECYFIPRSHIQLTPVLGGLWHVLNPDPETARKIKLFQTGRG